MDLILKEEIKSLGKAGDVVTVKEGFARNFLLPQGKAIEADTKNLKALEHHKKAVASKQAKMKKEKEELAQKLGALSLTIKKTAGEGDKLFGSIGAKDISEALRVENFFIDKREIHLEEPIKQLGIFEVPVRLHPEVTATVKVWVVKE